MEYNAKYGINCGVSSGFGLKDPDYVERTEKVNANSDSEAMVEAYKTAVYFSDEYLSDPDNDLTTVKILRLENDKGKILEQELVNTHPKIKFENGIAVAKATRLDHVLLHILEGH